MTCCEPPFPMVEPAYAEPVYTEAVYTEAVYTEPTYTEPVYTEPVYTEPVYTEPVYTDVSVVGPADWVAADPFVPVPMTSDVLYDPYASSATVADPSVDAVVEQMLVDQQWSILNANIEAHNQVMADATREIDMGVDYDYSGDIGDW